MFSTVSVISEGPNLHGYNRLLR